jgi:hydrogenase expression/formation protein HypE
MKRSNILLDHGGGGKMSLQLIRDFMVPAFDNPILAPLNDGAILDINGQRLAFSTDSFVVDPIFFPGGSIGDLSVNGTVNDLAMCGAVPMYLSLGLIIEDGFPLSDLEKILTDIRTAAKRAGVDIVTGDTKVVPRGAADKIFINTSGIGTIPAGVNISGDQAKAGDKILLSGPIADHGMAVLTQREGLTFESPVISDSAPLNHLVQKMLTVGKGIHALRDPTRGGVATTLNEIAAASRVGILIREDHIPINRETAGICELLGFDPLYVANEGKLIAFVSPEIADLMIEEMKKDELGRDACIIGEVVADHPEKVIMETRIGGRRIVDMLSGEQLPRIC